MMFDIASGNIQKEKPYKEKQTKLERFINQIMISSPAASVCIAFLDTFVVNVPTNLIT